jgi:hypothetical protein
VLPSELEVSLGVRGHALQACRFFVVADITHGRRRLPPARGCLLEPPHLCQREAEVAQRPTLTLPVTSLPEDGGRVLVSADRLLEPPRCRPGCPGRWTGSTLQPQLVRRT